MFFFYIHILILFEKFNYENIFQLFFFNFFFQLFFFQLYIGAIRKPPRKRKDHDVDVLMSLVSGLSFFKQLPTRVVRHLVREIRLVEVSPQKIICEQGTPGETMHVILR